MYTEILFIVVRKLGTTKFSSVRECTLSYGLFIHMNAIEQWK